MTDAQTVELGVQVCLSCYADAIDFHMLTVTRTGWASWSVSGEDYEEQFGGNTADMDLWTLVGHISMHAMRLAPSQARYPHLKGQIVEHGQLVQ